MEAIWWQGTENKLSYKDDIGMPVTKAANDVKIKVSYSGVCGSDFHFMRNEMGKFSAKNDGVILGHEFSGIVVELGDSVKNLKVGDRVCVNPNRCCGVCTWTERGSPHFCSESKGVGIMVDGGWAQYCIAPDDKVHKLPDNINQMQGALSEPYSCILRGWKRLQPLPSKSSKILVQGGGIIGILFCTVLHHYGFKNVTVAEVNEERMKICSDMKLGFDVVHPQEISLKLADKDVDVHGFEVIIDCTGSPAAVEKAFEISCRGGKICIFGCCPAGKKISVEPFQIYWKELTVVGSFINPFCFEETLSLMEELEVGGYLTYEKLGIKVFQLKQYQEALESLKQGSASKAIFNCN